MKYKELEPLLNGLKTLRGVTGVKFNYAVVKNVRGLEKELESLYEALKPYPEFSEYDQARIALAEKYSKRTENGEPVKEKDAFGVEKYVLDDKKTFDKEFDKLRKKYSNEIVKRQEQLEEFDKMMEEESGFEVHKISVTDVPESVTTEQMAVLYPIIED